VSRSLRRLFIRWVETATHSAHEGVNERVSEEEGVGGA
jgi:hypothetical protein